MAFDFKKAYKEFYVPKNTPEIVTVPKANYIAVRGKGNPNEEGGAYQQAVGILYAIAYTLKMSYKSDYKIEGFFEYVVPPLEGFWWQDGVDGCDYSSKKPGTKGAELVPELHVVSDNIFVKTKASALTCEAFTEFIDKNEIDEFYVCGADATACVKSTSYNMAKAGFKVHVISDCVTSYDLKKIDEMLEYYEKRGCDVKLLDQFILD